ncbi:MAG TPA: penicillin-binding protein 2 [Thermoleophilaceae bacterium]|nr:penicillin-binding protein 2 [Thermoleophilaceae bacterium]
MYLDQGKGPTITPQLALRVAIIGGIALACFAIVFFRLWYLQVLSGDRYLAEARDNRVRELKIQAPRGEVVDREGRTLVDNRVSTVIKVTPDKLPRSQDVKTRLYQRLAKLTGDPVREIRTRVRDQLRAQPFATATVKQDVDPSTVAFILENQRRFPGVTIETVFLRSYPYEAVGAHLFGTVGEITEEQLDDERYRGVTLGDRVGQSGIEYQYDRFLRGQNGARRLQVDAFGRLEEQLGERQPKQGRQLRLTIDLDVQRAGQRALGSARGSFVVMDVQTGQVRALGSSPSFDPNVFSRIIRQRDYERLTAEENGAPLSNRAIQGLYPTGSTFKLVTSVAALEGGLITPDTVQVDGGSIKVGGVTFKNAGEVAHGAVALRRALQVSSDVYFYRLGLEANGSDLIQDWARRLSLGRRTGIDLPGELPGLIPTEKWRNDQFAEFQRCKEKKKPTPAEISLGTCGFQDRAWSVGDNINLSVGQGDLQANPLQMAIAYAAVANGGKVVRPRLAERIEDDQGRVLQEFEPATPRRVRIKAAHRNAIMEGLRAAADAPGGTSFGVFQGFPVPVAGKTGTAEKGAGRPDQSWYVAMWPYPDVKYVAAVTFEAGGFGADTAAPAARKLIAAVEDIDDDGPKAEDAERSAVRD